MKDENGGRGDLIDGDRQRLVRLHQANGVRLLDNGDMFGSLLWFAEAMMLDKGDPAREHMHRTRVGAVLQQCPKLVQVWFQEKGVTYAEFSGDGRLVVTTSGDGRAGVGGEACAWDAATGRPVFPPLVHVAPVNHASFSPDARRVVTASGAGTSPDTGEARVWDAVTGEAVTPPLKHSHQVKLASFSLGPESGAGDRKVRG